MQQNRQSAQPTEVDAACKFPSQRLPSKNQGFSMAKARPFHSEAAALSLLFPA